MKFLNKLTLTTTVRKIVISLLFFLFSFCTYAVHKDKIFVDKFGNIKTLIKTGFFGYGSTEKVRIAGQLAQKLSLKLSYKKTIVIEFCHDYTDFYDKMMIVENGNPDSDYLIRHNIEEIEAEQIKSHQEIKNEKAICIRILDSIFDINKVLKIVEYCILNKFDNTLNNLLCKPSFYFEDDKMINVKYLGMSNEMIKRIVDSNNSELLNKILDTSINFYGYEGIIGIYKNGTFSFITDKIKFEIVDLLYLIELDHGICIFETDNSFVYLSENSHSIKNHEANIPGRYAYLTSHINFFERPIKRIENNNIMLYKLYENSGILFSEEKNEIVRFINK